MTIPYGEFQHRKQSMLEHPDYRHCLVGVFHWPEHGRQLHYLLAFIVQNCKHGGARHYRGKDWLKSQISQGKGEEAYFEFLIPRNNGNGFDVI